MEQTIHTLMMARGFVRVPCLTTVNAYKLVLPSKEIWINPIIILNTVRFYGFVVRDGLIESTLDTALGLPTTNERIIGSIAMLTDSLI